MPWLRIDDGFTGGAKIAALSDSDFRVWMRLLCYCAKTQRPVVDGLPRSEVKGLSPSRIARYSELDLLKEDGDDLVVNDWEQYNPPKDRTAADRMRRYRKRQKRRSSRVTDRNANGPPHGRGHAGADPFPNPVPEERLESDVSVGPSAPSPRGGRPTDFKIPNLRSIDEVIQ